MRRQWPDICVAILNAINAGLCKTQCVAKANLNFSYFGKYFDRMERAGLVKATSPLGRGRPLRESWSITERGSQFLYHHKKLQEAM